ncbi:hypothetical protein Halha_1850 [Halobacteroides halobius DSM 5150]|uniref:DUF456 domain-containing protein n=1 Tax=Halobacteroides halobius (strain ATCC 35273 / DSM 5150 / MD-1) TaxID=748449 RepID=L0KCG6_HALHC|nr:DUF456 domain-containing protein [Halobacteroides halobius]AGB41763.1 hypothetical protein Halha_1850 [Halobacteroides halobius DSM 5150]
MTLKIVVVIISSLGVLGTLVPGLPGTPLILLGAIIYGWITGWNLIGWQLVVGLIILSGLAELSERFFSVIGAKYFGGSKYGILGAVGGLILAPFILGPLGVVIGPLIGAILVEIATGQELKKAIKIGLGTIIGQLGGSTISFFISLVMISWLLMIIF